jgi:hypothetical protein
MLIFVNWSETSQVIKWWEQKLTRVSELPKEDRAAYTADAVAASPEFQVLLKQCEEPFKALDQMQSADPFNYSLMAVRFTVPSLQKSAKYSLSNRLPGVPDAKPPVSLACKSFLSATFKDFFFQYLKPKVENNFTFVSFTSETDFFQLLVNACAVLDSPIPQGIAAFSRCNHIRVDESEALRLVQTYVRLNKIKLQQAGTLATHEELLKNYQPGVSVDSSSLLLLTAANIQGITETESSS